VTARQQLKVEALAGIFLAVRTAQERQEPALLLPHIPYVSATIEDGERPRTHEKKTILVAGYSRLTRDETAYVVGEGRSVLLRAGSRARCASPVAKTLRDNGPDTLIQRAERQREIATETATSHGHSPRVNVHIVQQ
jgi:hypothetical protein